MNANNQKPERTDGRSATQLRPVKILRGILRHAEGSSWIRLGNTKVLCAVTVEERVPAWLRGRGHGWVTAEYGMLPRCVPDRVARNRVSGRSSEIQRLIARSLRAVVDLEKMPEFTVTVDCDVLEADGGTRVAAITAGWVALNDAFETMRRDGYLDRDLMKGQVAAISVGLFGPDGLLDLTHVEDASAQVDLNVVGTDDGKFVEVQGTAEGDPFDETQMKMMMKLARRGLGRMFKAQTRALALPGGSGFDLVSTR